MRNWSFRVRSSELSSLVIREKLTPTRYGGRLAMLVISRREQEQTILKLPTGERIVIAVTKIDRGKVRLAFSAPKEIEIWRSEIEPSPAA